MSLLPLLTCVLLGALGSQAKVVDKFDECKFLFYKEQEPIGMNPKAKKICQNYNNKYYFATLYSVTDRIPVYSAYTFDHSADDCSTGQERSVWFIEPQISGMSDPKMSPDVTKDAETIKTNQAINEDYFKTGFDRGHLNPNCFHKGDGRTATFTLTNAAPMDPCFNRIHWYKWENWLKTYLKNLQPKPTAPIYLVTGTVPQLTYKIPESSKRVTVPTHVWTALCYKDKDDSQSFSLGFIGQNKPGGVVTVMSISQLNKKLQDLYSRRLVKIFADECFSNNKRSEEIRKNLLNDIENPKAERLKVLVSAIENVENPPKSVRKRPRE